MSKEGAVGDLLIPSDHACSLLEYDDSFECDNRFPGWLGSAFTWRKECHRIIIIMHARFAHVKNHYCVLAETTFGSGENFARTCVSAAGAASV